MYAFELFPLRLHNRVLIHIRLSAGDDLHTFVHTCLEPAAWKLALMNARARAEPGGSFEPLASESTDATKYSQYLADHLRWREAATSPYQKVKRKQRES